MGLLSQPSGKGLPLGLTGATAATRYVGATASGAPGSGTFAVGDFTIDQSGKVYVCTVAGSPGTWGQVGATYTAPITRAQYVSGSTSIANNATATLPWTLSSGTALLDLTAPTLPTIVTAGVYALTIEVKGLALTAGGYFSLAVDMDAAGDDPQLDTWSSVASATLADPRAVLALTYYVPAAGQLQVAVTSKDGAAARDYQIVLAALQRIS